MVIRRVTLKALLWFCATLLTAWSFPLQVYANSPIPSLLPYSLIAIILMVTAFSRKREISHGIFPRWRGNIGIMIRIYVFLVLLNTGWQAGFGVISPSEATSALVIYLLPIVWYWYFRKLASEAEIRCVIIGIAVAGFVVGAYFAYDSFLKLSLGEVSDYAYRAFQYSLDRANLSVQDANDARIRSGFRGFGLLETHSVSGAWIVFGALATLTLVGWHRRNLRRLVLLVFGTMLLMALNFTAIMAFVILMFLFEFGGAAFLRGRVSLMLGRDLAGLALVGIAGAGISIGIAGNAMSRYMAENLIGQTELLLGLSSVARYSMMELIGLYLQDYRHHIYDAPFTLLIGDGFSSYGLRKGGDIGAIESMAKVGVPFFLAILIGIGGLIRLGLRRIRYKNVGWTTRAGGIGPRGMIQFAVSVTLLVLITEGHYSVWPAKSVLPVFLFALALFERYLPVRGTSDVPTAESG